MISKLLVVELSDIIFSSADVNVGDLVFLDDDAAALPFDVVKVLLGVRSDLLTGSSLEVTSQTTPVSAVKE